VSQHERAGQLVDESVDVAADLAPGNRGLEDDMKRSEHLGDELFGQSGNLFGSAPEIKTSGEEGTDRPIVEAGDEMVQYLLDNKPAEIGGVKVTELLTIDGVKYIMDDDSWLLIRPSGTEPVLRVYAEGRTEDMVQALLGYGGEVAESIT